MDAARFFEVAIPEMAQRRAALFGHLRGSLAFIIRGQGGWTVHLGAKVPVTPEADPKADLVLSFTPEAFDGFVDGSLDLERAMAEHQLAHEGDLGALTRFSSLLSADTNPLSVRLGGPS